MAVISWPVRLASAAEKKVSPRELGVAATVLAIFKKKFSPGVKGLTNKKKLLVRLDR